MHTKKAHPQLSLLQVGFRNKETGAPLSWGPGLFLSVAHKGLNDLPVIWAAAVHSICGQSAATLSSSDSNWLLYMVL